MNLSMLATSALLLSGSAFAYITDLPGDRLSPIAGEHAHDLILMNAFFDLRTDEFVVEARFMESVSPDTAATPLLGIIGFDLDNDPTTGDPPLQNDFPGLTTLNLGLDMHLSLLPSRTPDHVSVIHGDEEFDVPVEFDGDRFVVRIHYGATLRGEPLVPGVYGYAGVFGTDNAANDATDEIGFTYIVAPAPGVGALAAMGGMVAVGRRRR